MAARFALRQWGGGSSDALQKGVGVLPPPLIWRSLHVNIFHLNKVQNEFERRFASL